MDLQLAISQSVGLGLAEALRLGVLLDFCRRQLPAVHDGQVLEAAGLDSSRVKRNCSVCLARADEDGRPAEQPSPGNGLLHLGAKVQADFLGLNLLDLSLVSLPRPPAAGGIQRRMSTILRGSQAPRYALTSCSSVRITGA